MKKGINNKLDAVLSIVFSLIAALAIWIIVGFNSSAGNLLGFLG